jgi:hypothetical protein
VSLARRLPEKYSLLGIRRKKAAWSMKWDVSTSRILLLEA